ncbi:RNA polymerase sigma factor [Belliella marina]|uniref:RNA polymerase sigma factor n=1 Tax=Belliella marina TaxID=1644146 RepID=A0ABW4VJ29_9BACT
MDYKTLTDEQLWKLISTGDRTAFGFVFKTLAKDLFKYGWKFTSDKSLIEDVIQDVFIGLWNSREKAKIEKSIKFYLITAFRRELIRRVSSERKFGGLENCSENHFVQISQMELNLRNQELLQTDNDLHEAIGQLTSRQREAIYLKYFVELSYEEIAATLDMQVPSLYNLIMKAMKSLKTIMKKEKLILNVK